MYIQPTENDKKNVLKRREMVNCGKRSIPQSRNKTGCCKLYFCNAFIVLCLNAFYKMVWMDPTLMKFSIIYALCRVHISNIKNSKRYFKILFC